MSLRGWVTSPVARPGVRRRCRGRLALPTLAPLHTRLWVLTRLHRDRGTLVIAGIRGLRGMARVLRVVVGCRRSAIVYWLFASVEVLCHAWIAGRVRGHRRIGG